MTQYNLNTERKLGKDQKKNPRRYAEVGTFTTITHRKGNINKPGQAKKNLVPSVRGKTTRKHYPKHKKRHARLPLKLKKN